MTKPMRLLIAVLFLVAACAPPAPEAPPAAPEAPAPAWTFSGDEGVVAAAYGPPGAADIFRVICTGPTGKVTINSAHTLAHDQAATLVIVTLSETIPLAARGVNDGVSVFVTSEVDGTDPRLAALGAPQTRITVDVGGCPYVSPLDESITRVLSECR
jgi:hypothetical protein